MSSKYGNQTVEQLSDALNKAQDKLENKQLELESRERIETLKAQVELIKLEVTQTGAAGLAVLQSELQGISQRLSILGMDRPVAEEEIETESVPAPAGMEQPPMEDAGAPAPEGGFS